MRKQRIVELQKSLKIARDALSRISEGRSANPERTAEDALDEIVRLEPKRLLQGIVGHTQEKP